MRSTLSPQALEGMGAVPYADGVTFRVWAPHAQAVFVTQGQRELWVNWGDFKFVFLRDYLK
jgi:1,4-alpha-glucan branching enzyme